LPGIRKKVSESHTLAYARTKNKFYECATLTQTLYVIETPYSWFTTLHEFVHIILTEAEFEDDERMAYVIPAGVYYFYKYYGEINDDFAQSRL